MNSFITPTVEAAAGNLSSKTAYGSAVATSFMGLVGSSEFAVISGFAIAIGTFALNWYYKGQDNKRREQRHLLEVKEREARIANLMKNPPSSSLGSLISLTDPSDRTDTGY